MKKILQISNYYYPHIGGIEQVCRNIVYSLKDYDIEQKVVCFNEDVNRDGMSCKRSDTTVDFIDGIEIYRCGCFMKVSSQSISLAYPAVLKKIIKKFDPDVIVFHYPNPFVATFLLPIIKKDAIVILFWHLDITKQKIIRLFFVHQTKLLLDRANAVVPSSPNYVEGSSFLPDYKEKCFIISNCISTDFEKVNSYSINKAKEIRNKYKEKCICFTVGRHIEYKGFKYLIDSARYLNDDYIILIGGTGPLTESLKKRASSSNKIEFLGYLSEEDLKAYYMACDIITFSSITKNEAFGLSLAEGMSFSKPAVTFTIPGSGVNYVSINGVTGLEVTNRDSKSYAEAIKKLYCNKEMYKKFSKNARQRVLDLFVFEIFKRNILYMLKKLLTIS